MSALLYKIRIHPFKAVAYHLFKGIPLQGDAFHDSHVVCLCDLPSLKIFISLIFAAFKHPQSTVVCCKERLIVRETLGYLTHVVTKDDQVVAQSLKKLLNPKSASGIGT